MNNLDDKGMMNVEKLGGYIGSHKIKVNSLINSNISIASSTNHYIFFGHLEIVHLQLA